MGSFTSRKRKIEISSSSLPTSSMSEVTSGISTEGTISLTEEKKKSKLKLRKKTREKSKGSGKSDRARSPSPRGATGGAMSSEASVTNASETSDTSGRTSPGSPPGAVGGTLSPKKSMSNLIGTSDVTKSRPPVPPPVTRGNVRYIKDDHTEMWRYDVELRLYMDIEQFCTKEPETGATKYTDKDFTLQVAFPEKKEGLKWLRPEVNVDKIIHRNACVLIRKTGLGGVVV
ncbi:uncharacterized protein LOC121382150 [Gigantopelta aegis]|uniref:uncharacterized protein LOC121382150 n=1 Tax=Gigantopelta aegis TaxID=1735272 RepID=UPI001B8883A7|nr:uncharacterized protein LOC121382150 [Gigantopelta aegis]